VPAQYGGGDGDFRHESVLYEELARRGISGFGQGVHSIAAHYVLNYGTDEQKQRWLPRMARGELVGAIAMTEPGAGSDLKGIRTRAVREGDEYVVNGSKIFITNGSIATILMLVVRTDVNDRSRGLSILMVETEGLKGYRVGRVLDKMGMTAQDTSELFFEDVRVPAGNLLGQENQGFVYLMTQLPQERLQIAISGQAGAQRAFDEAVKFTKDRKAFRQTVFDFQNTRFTLANLKAKLQAGWAHLDWCTARHLKGELTAAEASAAKLFHTELQWEVCDAALQLHGGAGYMNEYPIARLWRDARVQRIYGGTSEIMKEVVARSI
ncbi:MAG: hypothetical protein RL588_1897, partial [Pseudomonadota bacterium]